MHGLIDAAIEKNRTVLLSLFLILIAGTIAYINIPKESKPDINIPVIYVSMTLEGISPEDAERLLIRPMEQELKSIEGVDEMRATAFLGGGNVVLEFDAGFNADKALEDVRAAVDLAKPDLPEEADEPTVNEVSFSDIPVIVVTLSGNVDERTLIRLSEDLQDKLENLPNVLEARIRGDREEALEVLVDPLQLESHGLNTQDVVQFVQRSNQLIAAGAMDTGQGRFAIKVPGLLENAQDVMELPLSVDGEAMVRFKDVASIRPTFKDAQGFARLNGGKAIALEITKRVGTNIIKTIEDVKKVTAEETRFWPDTITITYTQDQSTNVRDMLRDLQNNVISAILLVMILVVGALGVKSGLLVGISVPGSFLLGILTLSAMGLTVNVVVLFSLILAVGMLVDGAIVVVEYADRKLAEGETPRHAYAIAAKRMSWPIIASTATTLAAFFPLLFWPGIVGQFMQYMPITLLATLSASLLMALVFVPTLGSVLTHQKKGGGGDARVSDDDELSMSLDDLEGLTQTYVNILRAALKRPGLILLAAFIGLIGVQILYGFFGKGVEFFPKIEPEYAALQIRARGNLAIAEMDAIVKRVEAQISDIKEIKTIYATSGIQASNGGGKAKAEDVIGTIQLQFIDWSLRRPADEILAEVRNRTSQIGGIIVETQKEERGPPTGKDIQLEITARDYDTLAPTIATIRDVMEKVGGFINVVDSRSIPGIEWELEVDRAQAAKFNIDVAVIGQAVRMATNGMVLDTYRPEGARDEVDILVRFPEKYRRLDQLDAIRITHPNGNIPISNFVKRVAKPRVGRIDRVDAKRVMTVQADVMPGLLVDNKVKEIQAALEKVALPPGITFRFRGENEEQAESSDFLTHAFGIAIFIMALILVTQFNSLFSAGLILSAIILSTIGVFLGLLITHQPFGIVMGGVGVIALAGIVVNNNIVLIDTYAHLIKRMDNPLEAILLTGAQRLRPVLLTTVTTILGLLPMVFKTNIDFVTREVSIGAPSTQWWSQLSTSIAFGLAFATILTLIVTPAGLMFKHKMLDKIKERRVRRKVT